MFSVMSFCKALSVVASRSNDGIGDGWHSVESHVRTSDHEWDSRASARALDGEACMLVADMTLNEQYEHLATWCGA